MRQHRTMVGWCAVVLGSLAIPVAQAAQTEATPRAAATTSVHHAVPATSTATPPLDGTEWSVSVTPDAAAIARGEKPFDDAFVFAKGMVTLTACAKYGFLPSAYAATQVNPTTWTFTTQQESPQAGKNAWMATIHLDTINGTLTATRKDGTTLHYAFEGKQATRKST